MRPTLLSRKAASPMAPARTRGKTGSRRRNTGANRKQRANVRSPLAARRQNHQRHDQKPTVAGLEHDEFRSNCLRRTSPEGRGRIASHDAIRVRGYGLSQRQRPLTRIAPQSDLSPLGRGARSSRTDRFNQNSSRFRIGGKRPPLTSDIPGAGCGLAEAALQIHRSSRSLVDALPDPVATAHPYPLAWAGGRLLDDGPTMNVDVRRCGDAAPKYCICVRSD